MAGNNKQLHWSQRVALVRHNLHAASRSGNFHFFKTLQANGFMEGNNHVATLSDELGDDADVVLAAMDNLNAGLAYFYQDAFKNVYDNLKNNLRESDKTAELSKLYVDITMQKNLADMAIDRMASSALALIQQQPEFAQEAAAGVWILGATVVADTVEVALNELRTIDSKITDFIRLEESWNTVKASAVCAVSVLKGIFRLMDPSGPQDERKLPRSSSIVNASGVMLRRLSTALGGGGSIPSSRTSSVASASVIPSGTHARHSSLSSASTVPLYQTPNYVRCNVNNSALSSGSEWPVHKLTVIPATPGSGSAAMDDHRDPFDVAWPLAELPALPMPAADVAQRRASMAAF